jgi:hypothetical protein
MKKVKFKDLTGNKEVLKAEELSVLKGGKAVALVDGCSSGVCNDGRSVGATVMSLLKCRIKSA